MAQLMGWTNGVSGLPSSGQTGNTALLADRKTALAYFGIYLGSHRRNYGVARSSGRNPKHFYGVARVSSCYHKRLYRI